MAHTLASTLTPTPGQSLRHLQGGCQVVIRQSLGEIAQLCLKLAAADTGVRKALRDSESLRSKQAHRRPSTPERRHLLHSSDETCY